MTPQAAAIELPARWIAFLRPSIQSVGGMHTLEVASLPAALAFGAPARVTAVLDIDPNRTRLAVRGAVLDGRVLSLRELEDEPWTSYWLASLRDAIEADMRCRGATRPGTPSAFQTDAPVRSPESLRRASHDE